MKAQLKYAFVSQLSVRAAAFAGVTVMMAGFGIFIAAFPSAPLRITAVSLGGVGVAVMLAFNIIADIGVCRRMFTPPHAYLLALTPSPRRKALLASLVTMLVSDVVTMTFVVFGEVWLSFSLAGVSMSAMLGSTFGSLWRYVPQVLIIVLFCVTGYCLAALLILFGVAAKQSFFFKLPASGLLGALLAGAAAYAGLGLLPIITAPLGTTQRYGLLLLITLDPAGQWLFLALLAAETAALFWAVSRLMERKVNI
ncbi:MAG: hypothetical protein LBI44_04760 [Oscillospiraceae bacterium]|jgi:hypothetical protein|nr:hypothetical protein [Oscillospiraceae bacterium]